MSTEIQLNQQGIELFKTIDTTVERSLVIGTPTMAFALAHALKGHVQISGIALAKLLWLVSSKWEQFGMEDEFQEVVEEEGILSAHEALRYVHTWEDIFENPKVEGKYKAALATQTMSNLIMIGPAAREGQLENEHWERLANAADAMDVRDVIREVRGEKTSSNTKMIITLRTKDGWLTARKGGAKPVVLGILRTSKKDMEDETRKQAIAMICNGSAKIKEV